MAQVTIEKDKCKGCALCVEVCPKKLLRISPRLNTMGEHPVEWSAEDECSGCRFCVIVCPECAITIRK